MNGKKAIADRRWGLVQKADRAGLSIRYPLSPIPFEV
jgi:hypothetical protein